jgi:hypothetical protein
MQKTDTEYLLRKISAVDNRTVTDETVETWHEIVGHLSWPVAERALVKTRQDPYVGWLEPRHLVAKAREAIMELNDEARAGARQAEDEGRAEPEPKCAAHRMRITSCKDCCARLATEAGHLSGNRLHDWAVANVYVSEPF